MAHPARDIRERVQRQWPGAIVVGRGRASLTHQHPSDPARKRLDVALEPLHIAGTEIEIDTAWQPTVGAWQYEMTLADYQAYARSVLNAGDTIQYVDPGSGQSVTFQPLGLNWINRDNSRQQITQPGAVAAVVDDDILRWVDGYGAGRHFSWQTQTTRLQKLLTIDSPANLPAPAAWLGTGELWLELEFIIKNSAGVELYLDGVKWTRADNQRVRTSNRIEFRSLTTGAVLWYLDVPRAWDATEAEVIGQYEVRNQGGTHYITVRVPRAWLAAATYPVHVDPTITLQPDAAAGVDANLYSGSPNSNYGTSSIAYIGCGSSGSLYRHLLKFDLSSLPDNAILISSILTLYQTNARTNPNTIEIFRSKRAWVESQATWNEYATGSSWQEPGGFGADDCDATVIGSRTFTVPETAGYRDFVLTPMTKADLDFGNGWLLKAADEVTRDEDRGFRTSDYYTTAYCPRLVIEYIAGTGVTDALTANGITTGAPVLGAPALTQNVVTYNLTATAITAGTPTLGAPQVGQVHALTGTAITAAAPVLGRPAIGQVHVLTVAATVAGAPDLGTPAIGQIHALAGAGIVAGAPALGAAAIGQVHALTAPAITAGRPMLGSPIIGQIHAFAAVTLEAQAPALGAPALGQVHALTATAIVTGQPVLDAPSLARIVALTAAGITAGAPQLTAPAIGQVHALTAEAIAAGQPALGTPALVRIVALTASGIVTGAPQLTAPAIGQVHALAAETIAAGQPALGTPALVRIVALTASGIVTGAPQLTAPAIGQVHALTASGIVAGTPEAGRPVIGHVHVLVAALLLAGTPALGAPYLFLGQIVTPAERIYTIHAENRTYKVAAENRAYNVAAENRTYTIRR